MAKATCEQSKQISVFFLHKYGYFRHRNLGGILRWYSRDRVDGSVRVFVDMAGKTFQCSFVFDGRNYRLSTALEQTSCNFGGVRHWFSCPRCTHRVAILYLDPESLACRRCRGLAYRSSQTTHVGEMGALIRFMQLDISVGEYYSERRSKFWKQHPTKRHRRWIDRQRKLYAASKSVLRSGGGEYGRSFLNS